MSNNFKITLLIFIFFFSFYNCFSQTTEAKKKPLVTVLKTIENTFDVRFTYADVVIENQTIIAPSKNLSFKATINYLETHTNLSFKIINNRFVAIIKPKKTNPKKIEALNPVYLNSYLTSGVEQNNTGEIIIKPKKFGILPGLTEPDVLQTVQALPSVLSVEENVSNLNIRGGTHDQNLILWDGIKMYQSGHFFGLISAFHPHLTKKVILSKNGTSAIYGDGISSTIDIRLDDDINKESTHGAGINLIQASAFSKLKLKHNVELQIAGRRSITDFIKTPTYKQYFNRVFEDSENTIAVSSANQNTTENETFYFYDINAKLLYDISKKDKLRLNYTTIYNSLDYIENEMSLNQNNSITQRNLASSINYNRQWNNTLSSNLQFHYSNYALNALNNTIENNQRHLQNNKVQDNGFIFKNLINFNNRFNWIIGYQFNEVGITNLEDITEPQFRSDIKNVVQTHATFSEFNFISKNKKTHLKAGARSNYYKPFNVLLIEPRISVNQELLDFLKVEFLAEFKSQVTSQIIDRQNDFLGIEKRRWVLSNNASFPIIKSTQGSIGFHYNRNKLLISTTLFSKKVEGITTRSQGFQNQYQYVNAIGEYKINGIDFLVNKQFKDISTWLSYSFNNNNYFFPTLNNAQTFANNMNLKHAITFASTYSITNLKLALGINWHSGRPTTTPNKEAPIFDGEINYNTPNSSNLSSYFRTDFSSTYSFKLTKKSKAKAGFSIWNVFNKENILNTYYLLDNTNTIRKIENKSLGFTPNFSFNVSF